ncbi:hypothetical protein [Haloglomus litoreum]|uniref:hypothetical protein n=1 Tax=Haloglomus litoreum TaxID=3034026 RepID=UPI0023E8033C|nr:hypothetical protein [Haloglomus sp. DT116]
METLANPTEERTDEEPTDDAETEYRLRWYVADLAHYTAWSSDFGVIENLQDQYQHDPTHPGHDYAIERRTTEGQR